MRPTRGFAWRTARFLLLGTACCNADIAPTKFVGSGIAPAADTTVRMESAKVEIAWATPCKLSAEFLLANNGPNPKELHLGFPLPLFSPATAADGAAALAVEVNETKLVMNGPDTDPEDRPPMRRWDWYHGACTFPPGNSRVVVTSDLRASRVYGCPYRETIRYCIETGGKWAGAIGAEEVIVRFPAMVTAEQILAAKPDGFRVNGHSVRWMFEDIEPKGAELDIELTYFRPDAMEVIRRLRRELKADPASLVRAIELARHLFALGYSKSNSGFPPFQLTADRFREISQLIADPADRKIFTGRYQRSAAGCFEEIQSEWTEERFSVVRMLAEAGYRDEASELSFIREAEALLETVLAEDVHAREAWKLYLANYWRTSFAAGGHWFGPTHIGKRQIEAIEQAARNCPEDPVVRLWLAYARGELDRDEFDLGIKSLGSADLQFPETDHDYY